MFIQQTKEFLLEWNFDGIDLVYFLIENIRSILKISFVGLGISG
jgi:hypothetical protein